MAFQRDQFTAPPTSTDGSLGAATDTLEPTSGYTPTTLSTTTSRPARRRPAGACASRFSSASPPSWSRSSPAVASSAAAHKTVSVTVDGQQQEVGTLAGSVEGALDSAGLTVSEHDTVAPSVDTAISDGSQIVVERGRLLTLTIDGQTREVWTTATTVEEALAELGQNPAAFKLSADRSREIPLDGLAVTADTLFSASVSDRRRGRRRRCRPPPRRSATCSPSRASCSARWTPSSPAATTPLSDGLAVAVTRVARPHVTEEVEVAQPADQQVEDSSTGRRYLHRDPAGFSRARTQVTYQVTTTNGAETAKTEVSRTAVTPAQPTIIAVGTEAGASSSSASSSLDRAAAPRRPASSRDRPAALRRRSPPVPAASTGTASPTVSRPTTGRSTPATVTTVACSSTSAPGRALAATPTRRVRPGHPRAADRGRREPFTPAAGPRRGPAPALRADSSSASK